MKIARFLTITCTATIALFTASMAFAQQRPAPVDRPTDSKIEQPVGSNDGGGPCGNGNNCYVANTTPGCSNSACCSAICAVDPYCCNTAWDQICADAAAETCGNCGDPNAGNCYAANGSVGCNNGDCCAQVCAIDPYCCNTEWDGICADEAATMCGNCGNGDAGSCYSANNTPGCNNGDCCAEVCAADPYCCDTAWDSLCVDGAQILCAGCGDKSSGNCYVANNTQGCNNGDCCQAVCDFDPYCCETAWDNICANEAIETCDNCGNPNAGSCYENNGTPGCNNASCCSTVCALDPYCCETAWDGLCVDAAQELCAGCGTPNSGNCYVANNTPGCNNGDCCSAVCDIDPYCCETAWDGICADEAIEICDNCGNPNAGSCFENNGTPGCNNAACCSTVCAVDPYCCETAWDQLCADAALELCLSCGSPAAGNCYAAHGAPFCNDSECCNAVCAVDPYCCNTEWDGICADEAAEICGNCGSPSAGGCGVNNGTPGCSKGECCASVCAIDPYCCDTAWDGICANEANDLCVGPCPSDITGDGVVNVADLLAVITAWGPCGGCSADIAPGAGNNLVNVGDLLAVISAWGACPAPACNGWTCKGTIENCPGGDPDCFCWSKFGGGTACAQDFFCDSVPNCPDGNCPPGSVCVVLSCCGVNKCAPLCSSTFAPPSLIAKPGDVLGSGVFQGSSGR